MKFDKYIVLLTILSIGFLASIVRYGLRTYQIPIWDEQHYMRMATEFYRLLQHPSWSTPYDMLQIVPFRQPGYPLLIVPFLLIFGLSQAYFWGLVTNGLLYVVSIFGIYFLARLYISRLAAFLAAFIFTFYGWTLYYVHFTYSETATSAFCIWSIYFLIKSNYFQNKNYAFFFGLFLGLGLVTRWVAIIFVLGPLLYIAYHIIKKSLITKKVVVLNILLSFFVVFIVSFYPYYINQSWIYENLVSHRVGGGIANALPEQETTLLSMRSLLYYIQSFEQLGIFYFLLLFTGLLLAFKKKSKLQLILSAVIIPWILFSFFSILKSDRFILPIYPYLAILSASVFDNVKNKKYKNLLIVFTVLLSIGTFLGSVWGKGPMRENLQSISIHLTAISHPPYIYKQSGKEIVDFIVKDSKESGIENPQIVALFYYRPLDEPLMAHNLYMQEKPLQINNYLGTIVQNPENESGALLQNVLDNSDYILVKSGKKTDDYFPEQNYTTLKALSTLFDTNNIAEYYEEKVKIWIYQDSSTVTIFKKNKDIPEETLKKMKIKFVELLGKK